MYTKISLFAVALVSLQIVSSLADATVDESLNRFCEAPTLAGKGAERLRMVDASKKSGQFLSSGVKNVPAICAANNLVFRIDLEEPSADDKVMNAARAAIGETSPKAVEAAKAKLVELLKKDSELNVPLDNTDWLVRFLRFRKYDVPATYDLIRNYYRFKAQNKNIFDGLSPSQATKVVENNMFTVLPKSDSKGSLMAVAQAKNFDPKKFNLVDLLKTGSVLAEISSYQPTTQIAGVQFIFDASGLTMNHVKLFSPSMTRKLADYFLRAAPFRYEGIHVVKQNGAFTALFKIIKPFITKEVRNKLFFHGNDMKSLQRHFSPSVLPDIYGGSFPMPYLSSNEWNTILKTFDGEFAKMNSYGIKKEN